MQPPLSLQKKYWLGRSGALTEGLRQLGVVDLRVVREWQDELHPDEVWMLQRPEHTPVWVREIIMAISGIDCIFARSVTPLSASLGLWSGMRQLQTRPLADMLYNDPEITRSGFYTSRLKTQQPLYQSLYSALPVGCPPAHELLARCSIFWRCNEPLLVAECFLPSFWPIAAPESWVDVVEHGKHR